LTRLKGRFALQRRFGDILKPAADISTQNLGCVFEGEKATVDIAFEGILKADLPSGLKAGDGLKPEGRSVFEFQDGLIYRLIDYS
jgi:hypothetical protein